MQSRSRELKKLYIYRAEGAVAAKVVDSSPVARHGPRVVLLLVTLAARERRAKKSFARPAAPAV